MKLIPVLDILKGLAVHARGGDRDHYAPVRSILHEGSDPVNLARSFRHTLQAREVYLADLDAILGREPNWAVYEAIRGLGLHLLLDPGIRDADDLDPRFLADSLSVVVGLETVRGPQALAEIVSRAGADRVIFGLDLRDGRPLVPTAQAWATDSPEELAHQAIHIGVRTLILLDLARVGGGNGVGTEALLRSLARHHPEVSILVGGGIAGPDDLARLQRLGASGALVGSALHDGRITGPFPV